MKAPLKFKGGFGVWTADAEGFTATIRAFGFGRIRRYNLWVNGGTPVGSFNTYDAAKQVANNRYQASR